MAVTLTATLDIDERQLRVEYADARRALEVVTGHDLITARARLRYGPGRTCEVLARVLDTVIVQAEDAGLDPAGLLIADGTAEPDEDIVRVRRKAHGKADWIHSPTSHVRITLQPAGLHATQPPPTAPISSGTTGVTEPCDGCAVDENDTCAAAVQEALFEVIDPDLGVNIVDLGFVREVRTEQRTAIITITLTSPACPLTGVMEDQIRTGLATLAGIDDFRVNWVWLPPWQPGDITDSGREQLRAIGFTI